MRRPVLIIMLVGLSFLGIGCSQDNNQPQLSSEQIEKIRAKAMELAEHEMVRFSMAEQEWKDSVNFYRHDWIPIAGDDGVYSKAFRHFTNFNVENIRLIDSLIHPIECVIKFEFDVYTTEGRHSSFEESEDRALEDDEYRMRYSDNLVVTYLGDFDGYFGMSELVELEPPHFSLRTEEPEVTYFEEAPSASPF